MLFSFKREKYKKANCYAYIKNKTVAIAKLAENKKDKIVLTVLNVDVENCWWNKKEKENKNV